MHDNLAQMRAFLDRFQSGDWEGACADFCQPDFEIHEPPGLPQSGVHRGKRAPIEVSNIYRGIWDVEIGEQSLWATRDADMVFSRYIMKWTSKATGKALTQPVVELNRFRDGKLASMEVFMSDPIGLMATLQQD
ncbi:nuclear transport factor 2 family protein [Candidatus Poribacteria bacterium]|nr:nuclear transport factor 2 family protein [Candidatus Poribacteria bacterium]MYF70713.1 nuclear transport factor 2 family protein [Pseudomonadota bacterium]MYJ94928.1 nuclear transport factor 2 family protein [Pseudomonadota bacterium]